MKRKLKIALRLRSKEQGFVLPIVMRVGLVMLLISATMSVSSQGDRVTALKLNKHLSQQQGFTLIELLVVIIIIGILSSIAIPSFLNQANKAKQSEAKQYVGMMNRAQQAYYLENGLFSIDLQPLAIGIKSQTTNYNYEVTPGGSDKAANNGISLKPALKSYTGVVIQSQQVVKAILCESQQAGVGTLQSPGTTGTPTTIEPKCPNNFVELK